MPKRSRFASICDGLRKTSFVHVGRGLLPLLAVMLLASPQLAFAQGNLAVTVNPRTLEIAEGGSDTYDIVLDADPGDGVEVRVTVVGASTDTSAEIYVESTSSGVAPVEESLVITFTGGSGGTWDDEREIEINVSEDPDAVDETVVLTHTAVVEEDGDEEAATLRNVTVTVNVDDNDTKRVTVSANTVNFLEATATGTYAVVLNTQPTATVTVDVAGASGEITVSPSRLFFTPETCPDGSNEPAGCWNRAQTVTVYAGEDFDAEPDTATLTHKVRGGDYTGVSVTCCTADDPPERPGTVAVTVNDNDTRGVSVSTGSLNITVGATTKYTVRLDTRPTGAVIVSLAHPNNDDDPNNNVAGVTVTSSPLRFSSSNWNRGAEVTVSASSSASAGSYSIQHAVVPATSSGDDEYDTATIVNPTVNVTIETALPRVILSPGSLSINEGASKTYGVRLNSQPDNDLTVAVASSNSDVTVDDADLVFTTTQCPSGSNEPVGCWNRAQTVMVSVAEDDDAESESAELTHRSGSATGAILVAGRLTVTVTENDRRRVIVDQTSLEVPEGDSATYSIALASQPTGALGNVTVTITGTSGDVTVDPSQLTFTAANWFTAQPVKVNAAEDSDGETDAAVTLRHTVRGADYDGITVDNVRVTIRENEMLGFDVDTKPGVDETQGALTINEGAKKSYEINLTSQPTGTVTVMVEGASGDVTVDPPRLIFTTGNWDDPQTVTVNVSQDADGEPDPVVTLAHAASGGGYNGVTGGRVTVTVTEDDQAKKGLTITPSALTVTEGSASSYTVVLNTEPTGTVTVTLGGLGAARAQTLVVSPTTLTFTQRNWNIRQTVTVTAAEDETGGGGEVTLTHSSRGGGYDSTSTPPLVAEKSVVVTVIDNDEPGLKVTPMRLEIPEGTSRTYTVALSTKPTDSVSVAITDNGNDVTASPTPLVFTPQNWSVARIVRVHVDADATDTSVTVTNSATSTDTDYQDESEEVTVVVKDKDTPDIAINPTTLSVTEGGSASYTMVLTKAPTASVRVAISGISGDVRLDRTSVSFSTTDWNREKSVTVSLVDDADAVQDEAVTLTHKVTGADEYEDITISSVAVTLTDKDTRGVSVTPTSLTIAAGVTGTYQVKLNSQPTDTVELEVNSPRKDVTVTGSPLIFTTSNWNTNQPVTVMVDKDAGSDEVQSVMLTHSVSGGDYPGVRVPDVAVTIPVEGTPSVPTGLSATAGDQQVTLSWGEPASDGGSEIVRYEYRYQKSGSDFVSWVTVPGGASASSYTVPGLENGTSYTFEVRAVNSVGGGQGVTASATLADSVPGAPANLAAAAGDEQVALTWDPPADGGSQILRYEYRYAESGETYSDWMTVSGAGNARSVTVSSLTNGTLYGFEVRAVNSVGEGEASQASATPGRAPSAPTGIAARVESETITVMWGMPVDTGGSSVTGYQVRYRMNGSNWSNWMDVEGGASATSYTMTGLSNGIGHEIEVRAVNSTGAGAAASVEATPMEGVDFAHFANGTAGGVTITSDIVLVNVETSTVTPAIYFYNQMGEMIDADSVVDVTGDLGVAADGALTVPMGIAGRGEMTISTNGEGALVVGSVRVFGTGRLGGVLRFDIPAVGVAGVGASEPVNDAIFPARRMLGGIRTGAAIRNLSAEDMTVTCMLMQGGQVMDSVPVMLPGDGHSAQFIDEMFPGANTTDFVGSVRCTAPEGGMFVGVALEMDAANGIFTTLPMVPLGSGADSGESTLNFAHFATGDFGGTATTSDLVFVNVASSAVSPAIYFYDQMGNMIDASMVVDAMMDGVEVADGALMVTDEIPAMGEMTISTSSMGDGMVGSVRVVSDGPIGGVLRFNIPAIGVAGVGASEAVNAAIFPARRMADGINTGAAIRNLMAEPTTVTCRLMAGGQRMGEQPITLPGNGQNSEFINEMFKNANTNDFEGSVHCTAPAGSTFTGVALEMDFNNRIFTTLPVVPVQ